MLQTTDDCRTPQENKTSQQFRAPTHLYRMIPTASLLQPSFKIVHYKGSHHDTSKNERTGGTKITGIFGWSCKFNVHDTSVTLPNVRILSDKTLWNPLELHMVRFPHLRECYFRAASIEFVDVPLETGHGYFAKQIVPTLPRSLTVPKELNQQGVQLVECHVATVNKQQDAGKEQKQLNAD